MRIFIAAVALSFAFAFTAAQDTTKQPPLHRKRTCTTNCALRRVAMTWHVGYVEGLIEAKIESRFGRDAQRFHL